ncbi:MAG TPA: FHA domain-containing protein [Azospirillum sp.]|nr:FHA domain-containing protein [Azospirillum sp.]
MIPPKRAYRYEVVVELGGRPNIDGVFDDEKLAMERAKYLLTLAKYQIIRVVKVNKDGKEETLFEKAIAGGGKVTTISHIEEAAFCKDVLEVFSFPSRMTLLRLFRAYCDEQTVIPAEQLHRYFPLRYFEREATLFNPGISRLATLQAPVAGIKVFDRQDQILRMFKELKDLAQNADALKPFDGTLLQLGVAGLLSQARNDRPAEELDRIVTHAFASALEDARDWGEKLSGILRFHVEGDPETVAIIDQLLCETVDGREPAKALIGYAPDLATALQALLATLRGDLDDRLPHTEPLLDLSNAVATGGFTHVREALLRRVRGGIEGKNPLTRLGAAADAKAFQTIVDQLAAFDGFMGGPEMAAALMKRAKIAWGAEHRDMPFDEAVMRLSNRLGSAAARIGFLLDLAASEFGRRRMTYLVEQVANMFARVRSARELAPAGASLDEVRAGLGHRLRNAGIPRLLADGLVAKVAAIPDEERVIVPLIQEEVTVDLSTPKVVEPKLVVNFKGRRHVLPDEGTELFVGRSRDCHVMIEVPSASRRHARFAVEGVNFVVSDLSRNGTRLIPEEGEARVLMNGETAVLSGKGEIVIGSKDAGEKPATIHWEVRR